MFPAVARFTRACAYDRPGTYLLPGTLSRSDPVAMPRSIVVVDLRKLLHAADVPGPMFWSVTPSAAWLPASMRPFARAGSPASCRSTHRMRTSSPGTRSS